MKKKEALEKYSAWMERERLAPLTRESYMGWAERFLSFRDPVLAAEPAVKVQSAGNVIFMERIAV